MAHRFWKQHSKYVVRRDELQDREDSLRTRLAYGHKELEKLQRTNVYSTCSPVVIGYEGTEEVLTFSVNWADDAFCIGQEAGFGTINGLRLGRLPGINVRILFGPRFAWIRTLG